MPRPPRIPGPAITAQRKVGQAPTAAMVAQLAALGQAVRQHCDRGDFQAALSFANQALALAPGHPVVLGDLALCRMRLGQLEPARQAYLAAVRAAPGAENVLDGLAECCGALGLTEEVRRHGHAALAAKAAQVAGRPGRPLPALGPPPFDASRPQRNLLSFSLFGASPRYCETAILNVQASAALLPGWRCRFHVDASVPQAVQQRLLAAGAQVVDMDQHPSKGIAPLMWRFLVLDDPGVDRYLLRDADSLVSVREVAAVQAWLDSNRWFHLMRDWATHSELLLAGMWGGCGGVFQHVSASLQSYSQEPPRLGARLIDQHWLRHHAWPTVRQSVLSHDGVFGFFGGLPFPPHAPVTDMGAQFHVGANIGGTGVGGAAPGPDGRLVPWRLLNAQGQEVCRYDTPSRGGQWQALLPKPYVDGLRAGGWRCELLSTGSGPIPNRG